jgi:glycine betaine/proline transport system substrate-binding protein
MEENMINVKSVGIILGVSTVLALGGCADGNETGNSTNETVSEQVGYTITGIEPGAGITGMAHQTLEGYENLAGWELEESSTGGMLTLLDQAIANEEPIIFTGWAPHWMFSEYDLKYLEDPNAYKILDAFQWEVEDMEAVMFEAQESSFEESAANWIEANKDKVDMWLEGTEKVDGEKIELVSTPWDTERASSLVAKAVLEGQGYDVTVTDVDPAVLFEAIANGSADVSLAPWLPITHASFYEKHKDNIVDLGENLTGAKNGLVVPSYMDIDSIEELEPKE